MITRKLNNENKIDIVGIMTDAEVKTGVSAKGTEYINGKVTVKVQETKTYALHFYANKITKDGTISKLYNTYSSLPTYIGRKVSITGSIREAKISAGSEIRYGNSLDLRFINILADGDQTEECAKFSVSGYIIGGLTDVYNEDGTTIRNHIITVGQANYNNSEAIHIRLNVDPKNVAAVNSIRNNFTLNTTVNFKGVLDFRVENQEIVEENDFGGATTRIIQRSTRNYLVQTGKIFHDDNDIYLPEEIKELEDAYKLAEARLLEHNNAGGSSSAAVPPVSHAGARTAATPHLL